MKGVIEINLEERYLKAALKSAILNVASSLDTDSQYNKEQAVEDLIKIVDDFFDR